jgi:branched-chain amino acid aminotransferase
LYLFYCNRFYKTTEPVLQAGNRAFRYGEAAFETIKAVNGRLLFANEHFNRIKQAMECLCLPLPKLLTQQYITGHIEALLKKNGHTAAARVRLTVWRGNGGLYEIDDGGFEYCIESFPLEQAAYTLNDNGLVTDIFTAAHKPCDAVSNFKTASHLVYALAAGHAKKERLNDCLVLNTHGRVCDSTIANIFVIKNGEIITPPLSEGCIAGIMRQYLLGRLPEAGFAVTERPLMVTDVQTADELFVTNVIKGIRWVKSLDGASYSNKMTRQIHEAVMKSITG